MSKNNIKLDKSYSMMDIGSSTGDKLFSLLSNFTQHPAYCHCVDGAPRLLELLSTNAGRIKSKLITEFHAHEANFLTDEIPVAKESIDVLTSFRTINYLLDIDIFLNKAISYLKKDGIMVIDLSTHEGNDIEYFAGYHQDQFLLPFAYFPIEMVNSKLDSIGLAIIDQKFGMAQETPVKSGKNIIDKQKYMILKKK
jgi:ubiquinone/menaquinone biosynthesis C-methylase UbiE